MKTIILSFLIFCHFNLACAQAPQTKSTDESVQHNAWLKQKFSEQHQNLIPKVAVADMLFSCNQARKIEPVNYQLNDLILRMDKNRLAEKLIRCLGNDSMKSDIALNFGLLGCFEDQLVHLPDIERKQKMDLVKKTIHDLPHNERKKSFTQCVSAQAINYLQ
jgi:hypothetical protein